MKLQLAIASLLGLALATEPKTDDKSSQNVMAYTLKCEPAKFKFVFYSDAECKNVDDQTKFDFPKEEIKDKASKEAKCAVVTGVDNVKFKTQCTLDGSEFKTLDITKYETPNDEKCADISDKEKITETQVKPFTCTKYPIDDTKYFKLEFDDKYVVNKAHAMAAAAGLGIGLILLIVCISCCCCCCVVALLCQCMKHGGKRRSGSSSSHSDEGGELELEESNTNTDPLLQA